MSAASCGYNGSDNKRNGVGIVLRKGLVDRVVEVERDFRQTDINEAGSGWNTDKHCGVRTHRRWDVTKRRKHSGPTWKKLWEKSRWLRDL